MFGKRKPSFYDMEIARIQAKMETLEVGSEEYKKSQTDLKEIIAIRGNDKESRRRISKDHKGQMLIKGLGIGGIVGSIILMSKHEKDGYTYSGENRRWVDILCNNLGRFNLFG